MIPRGNSGRLRISVKPVMLSLAEPFVTKHGETNEVPCVQVEIHDGGAAGYGIARGRYCPLDESGLIKAQIRAESATPIFAELLAYGFSKPATVALEMAIFDLLAKEKDCSLGQLVDGGQAPIPVSAVSIGANSAASARQKAAEMANYPILKIKCGGALLPKDIHAIREVYEGRIWVDGNGAWNLEEAAEAIRILVDAGVELLEQPVKPGGDRLWRLQEESPIPLIADEDFASIDDVKRLCGKVSGVNLKVHKFGGIGNTVAAIDAARRAGLAIMIGCKTESSLAVTVAAHLAGGADYADLDGHLDLTNDPFSGLVFDRGLVSLPTGSGIGATPVNLSNQSIGGI